MVNKIPAQVLRIVVLMSSSIELYFYKFTIVSVSHYKGLKSPFFVAHAKDALSLQKLIKYTGCICNSFTYSVLLYYIIKDKL